MITKERLEELIEQGATIYEVDIFGVHDIPLKQGDYVEKKGGVLHTQVVVGGYNYFYDERLFENKAEAEWHAEFGCIERTECLELPTWEEVNQICLSIITFINKDGRECNLVVECFENRITVNGVGGAYDIWELTKENYTLACRKCKELFLGENE